jgi:voltage-gated potassium channel
VTSESNEFQDIKAYDLGIALLAIVVAAATTTRLFMPDEDELAQMLDKFDYAICGIFLIDFIRSLVTSDRKLKYLFTWGLFDLVSAIPTVGPFRYLKIARVIRVVRVVRSLRILMQVVHRDRPAAAIGLLVLIGMSAFVGICIGVLHFERDAVGSTIKTGDDVVWWAIVTVSTVGYGDEYPVTENGRILAAFLMVVGIGAFATSTTALGVFFKRIQPSNVLGSRRDHERVESLHDRMERIERLLTRVHENTSSGSQGVPTNTKPPSSDDQPPPSD